MESGSIIMVMILLCLALLVLMMIAKPIKIAGSILLNGVVGAFGLFIVNFLLQPMGIHIGINLLTTGFIGILGLPGFAAVVLIGAIL